jgi:hypothetical protein
LGNHATEPQSLAEKPCGNLIVANRKSSVFCQRSTLPRHCHLELPSGYCFLEIVPIEKGKGRIAFQQESLEKRRMHTLWFAMENHHF